MLPQRLDLCFFMVFILTLNGILFLYGAHFLTAALERETSQQYCRWLTEATPSHTHGSFSLIYINKDEV